MICLDGIYETERVRFDSTFMGIEACDHPMALTQK